MRQSASEQPLIPRFVNLSTINGASCPLPRLPDPTRCPVHTCQLAHDSEDDDKQADAC